MTLAATLIGTQNAAKYLVDTTTGAFTASVTTGDSAWKIAIPPVP